MKSRADIGAVEVRWWRRDADVGVGWVAAGSWAATALLHHVEVAVGDPAVNDPIRAGVDGLAAALRTRIAPPHDHPPPGRTCKQPSNYRECPTGGVIASAGVAVPLGAASSSGTAPVRPRLVLVVWWSPPLDV